MQLARNMKALGNTTTAKLAIAAIALLVAVILPFAAATPAHAKTLATTGTWTTCKPDTWYKISVPSEGYLEVSADAGFTAGGSGDIFDLVITDGKSTDSTTIETLETLQNYSSSEKRTVTKKLAVSKGTYYLKFTGLYYNFSSQQVKCTFTSITQPKNYCIAKAKTLKRGKTTTIYNTQKYSFDRYFKITLTSAKKITITRNTIAYGAHSSFGAVKLYDSYGHAIKLDNSAVATQFTTTSKLAKGTYYIKVPRASGSMNSGTIQKISWSKA